MIIVDRALRGARGAGQADPRRDGRRGLHGPGAHEPDREQRPGHAHGGHLQPPARARLPRLPSTPAAKRRRGRQPRRRSTRRFAPGQPVVAEDAFAICRSPGDRRGRRRHRLGRVRRARDPRGLRARQARRADERRGRRHHRPHPARVRQQARGHPLCLRRRRAGRADEPLPLGQRARADPARDGQRQGAAGPLPQPHHPAGMGGALGSERGDGHLLRRRLEDQLRADHRGERHRLQGAVARHVAGPRVRRLDHGDPASSTTSTKLRALGGIVDYTVGPPLIKVFCLAEHTDPKQRHYLNLYKMGEGPLYPFWIPYHLVHFETPFAIARVVLFGDELAPPLGGPVVEVCAVAKRDLKAGEVLDEYGMYMTYGEAVNVDEMSAGRYLPEGLVEGCRMLRDVAKDSGPHLRRRGAARRADCRPAAGRAVPAFPRRDLARAAALGPAGRSDAAADATRRRDGGHEGRPLLRRPGDAAARLLGVDPQAHGAGRLPADPLARHALLRAFRPQGLHPVPGLQGGHHQAVLPQVRRDRLQRLRPDARAARRSTCSRSDIHDWKITFVDTGPELQHRACGSRRCSPTSRARRCSSPTTATACPTCPCRRMIDYFQQRADAVACFAGVAPDAELPPRQRRGRTAGRRASGTSRTSGMRINGGFFVFRQEIFDWMQDGRGTRAGAVPAAGRRGQAARLPATTASGRAWTPSRTSSSSTTCTPAARSRGRSGRRHGRPRRRAAEARMLNRLSARPGQARPPRVLALGAHADDIEIGCGGTLLRLVAEHPDLEVTLGRLLRVARASRGGARVGRGLPGRRRDSAGRGHGTTGTASCPTPARR